MAARSIEWREAARGDLFEILDYTSDDIPEALCNGRLVDGIQNVTAAVKTALHHLSRARE